MKYMNYSNIHNDGTKTIVTTVTDPLVLMSDLWQVTLFNDDVNSFEHVVISLMKVFGHTSDLAIKITIDAHKNGKSVAEVEEENHANRHKQQLQSLGLTASIEIIC
jgi:ATP-dependent Clp protease adaptor protein ClpS